MTRMTKALAEAIVDNALKKAGFRAAQGTYNTRYTAWVEAVRIDACGGAEALAAAENLVAQVNGVLSGIPEKLLDDTVQLRNSRRLRLNAGGGQEYCYFYAADGTPEYRTSPAAHTLESTHPLYAEREALKAEDASLDEQYDNISGQVRGALKPFTTVKQLLEAWPEAKELLPDMVPESKPQLPAVLPKQLNELIGLPSEESAE